MYQKRELIERQTVREEKEIKKNREWEVGVSSVGLKGGMLKRDSETGVNVEVEIESETYTYYQEKIYIYSKKETYSNSQKKRAWYHEKNVSKFDNKKVLLPTSFCYY